MSLHDKAGLWKRARLGAAAVALCALVGPAQAGTITVSWDAVSDPDLTGYRLYWGTSHGSYSQSLDVGTGLSHTIGSLSDCTTYYVALKSLDTQGMESGSFSQELSGYTRPSVTAVTPSLVSTGTVVDLVVDGVSFQAGAGLQFSRPGLSVQSLSVDACGRITAVVAVSAGMAAGPVDVTVVNPGGVPGTMAAALTVGVDVAPADVTNLHRTDLAGLP